MVRPASCKVSFVIIVLRISSVKLYPYSVPEQVRESGNYSRGSLLNPKFQKPRNARYGEQRDSCNQPSPRPSAGDGMGNFNLVEGVIDHHILGIHDVVEALGVSIYDYAFLGSGVPFIAIGFGV